MNRNMSREAVYKKNLEVMRYLSDDTENIQYILDVTGERMYFSIRIDEKYDLLPMTDGYYTLDQLLKIIGAPDVDNVPAKICAFFSDGAVSSRWQNCTMANRHGERLRFSIKGKTIFNEQGQCQLVVGSIRQVVSQEQNLDIMTGLPDAQALIENLDEALQRKSSGFLLILGIDNLRNINAIHGREFGNEVLRNVADILKETVSWSYQAYRLDSDKFAVNLFDADKDSVRRVYWNIRDRVGAQFTISLGAADYSAEMGCNAEEVFQHAESALILAKNNGKNTLSFFSADDYEKQLSLLELEEELKQSVMRNFEGFYLQYQPQIDCKTIEIFGAEALVRYRSPTRGRVGPDEFIPILEQTGLIVDVGEWVLHTALKQAQIWRKAIPNFHISINVSYIQLREPDAADRVLKLLEEYRVPGEMLTLEVTESVQLQDYQLFNKIFYKLGKQGVEISIDDFGTGYSSLSYLKGIEVDEIKIDRCFVSRIQHSAYNYRLLSNMIDLSHSAGIRVCCEGVETEEELMTISELHPDLLQGYLFAKPYDVEEFNRRYIDQESEEYLQCRRLEAHYRGLGVREYTEDQERVEKEKLSSIVDAMEELVYVRNPNSHELLYLNEAGRELSGIYDYKGRKCYEILQGKTAPCERCMGCQIKGDDYIVWEINNQHLKKQFLLKSKLIPWQGEMANLTIAIDVTEKEITSQKIQEKLDFERNIIACTRMLLDEQDQQKAIEGVLHFIGEFYQAERAYLFELQDNKLFWNNTYEWCDEGVVPQKDNMQDVPIAVTRRWLTMFRRGESIVIDDVDTIKDICYDEWETLSMQDIHHLIVSPVWKNQTVIGFIGVDNPQKYRNECSQVQTMACFLADRILNDRAKERLGELLNLHYADVLKATDLGLWVIRINPGEKKYELFADHTFKEILGIKGEMTPEETYMHWYSRINDGYYHYVNYGVESMIKSDRPVELVYTWNHPVKGEVTVRCLGICVENSNGMICLEGYHREINEVDKPGFLPDKKSIIFEYNEKKGSIYFHNSREPLFGTEEKEEDFPNCWLNTEIVHPHYADKFKKVFDNIRDQQDIDNFELLLKNREGIYEWFRLKTHHMGGDEQDAYMMLVMLNPAENERALELRYQRQKDFYKAILSEKIMYIEIDMESQRIVKAGGQRAEYISALEHSTQTYEQILNKHKDLYVHPDDVDAFAQFLSKDTMLQLLRDGKNTGKLQYRSIIDGEMRWVEMTGHVFREEVTEHCHALLYIKDIDAEKKRELMHEFAATRDSLTNVFNHNAFEEEVVKHVSMAEQPLAGTLILLDMDHFKDINDRYGHQEGDAALKRLVKVLMTTFRRKDLIGRLGGDEFLIFLKDVNEKEIINRRIAELREALNKASDQRDTCSVGITLVRREGFSYAEALKQADAALYLSKKKGRNTYSYYSETL